MSRKRPDSGGDTGSLEYELAPLLGELANRTNADAARPIVFTAPSNGAGTTTICLATASALAQRLELDLTLVEANLSAPTLAQHLGLPPTPGLAEVLEGTCEPAEALTSVPGIPSLSLLPAGRVRPPRPGELGSRRMRKVLGELGTGGRMLLIDGPPLDDRYLAPGLLRMAADVVLVLSAQHTRRSAAVEAAQLCKDGELRLLGTVMNRA